MKAIVILAVLCAIGFAAPLITSESVNEINSKQSQWKAEVNRFTGMGLDELKRFCSVKIPQNTESTIPKVSYESLREFITVPDNFDTRDKWPACKSAILDQGQCGSCWAFGAVEAFQDRLCIVTAGKTTVLLSEQALVDCDPGSFGCSGGWPDKAFEYIRDNGIPTETCYPYKAYDQNCKKKCADGSDWKVTKGKNVRKYKSTDDVKTDILTNGPVETWFAVYDDFFSYKSGIYSPQSPFLVGYHAVEVLGWGVTGGVHYWTAANSWATSWGDSGYFKIEAGTCEFDDLDKFVAGDASA